MSLKDFKEKSKSIDWKASFQVNFLRTISSGLVLMLILVITGSWKEIGYAAFFLPLLMPLLFLILIPISLFFTYVLHLGIANVFISILFILGDPLIFILKKLVPQAVPVEKYRFINFAVLLYVQKNEDTIS